MGQAVSEDEDFFFFLDFVLPATLIKQYCSLTLWELFREFIPQNLHQPNSLGEL